jgi:hypothetical protein
VKKLLPDLLRVNANRDQLKQVFLNITLIEKDAMPNGGELFIETKTANQKIDEGYIIVDLFPNSGHLRVAFSNSMVSQFQICRLLLSQPLNLFVGKINNEFRHLMKMDKHGSQVNGRFNCPQIFEHNCQERFPIEPASCFIKSCF